MGYPPRRSLDAYEAATLVSKCALQRGLELIGNIGIRLL